MPIIIPMMITISIIFSYWETCFRLYKQSSHDYLGKATLMLDIYNIKAIADAQYDATARISMLNI